MHRLWSAELKKSVFIVLINSVLCMAIIALMAHFGAPVIYNMLPVPWAGIVTAVVTLFFTAPLIWMLMRQGSKSKEVNRLWDEGGRIERIKLSALAIMRFLIAAAFISYIIGETLPRSGLFGIFAVLVALFLIFFSSNLEKRSNKMVKTFTENLSERESE